MNDFDYKDEPPMWLPQEKWEDILALSVLPGPLDSLCVNFAQHSDAWKSWYKSPYPEKEPLPLAVGETSGKYPEKAPPLAVGKTSSKYPEKETSSKKYSRFYF